MPDGPWDKYANQEQGPWSKYQAAQPPVAPAVPERGAMQKLFGIGGERYQLWPERVVREIGSDIKGLMESAYKAPISPEGAAALAPQAAKVAAEVTPLAPGARAAVGGAAELVEKAGALRRELPTMNEIKASGKSAYKMIEDARLIAFEGSLNGLVSATRAGLDQRLFTDVAAPRTFKSLERLQKSGGDIAQIIDVYEQLGKIKPDAGDDFAAAQHVRDAIKGYVDNLPETEVFQGEGGAPFTAAMWKHARESWRSYAELNQISSAEQIGRHRAAVAGVGANTQNAMRQRIREILDSETKSRGYSPAAKDQMENIVMGTWATNSARYAGKYAPSGPVSTMAPIAAYFAGGGGEARPN